MFIIRQKFTPRALIFIKYSTLYCKYGKKERRRISCLLDDIGDEEIWGVSCFTDKCSPDEHVDILENEATEQSRGNRPTMKFTMIFNKHYQQIKAS